MTRNVTVAATQMACSWDRPANIARAEKLVRQAAARGAQIILIQELFETPYFCQKPNPDYLQLATTVEENAAIAHFQALARELQVVLPISFFERAGRARFSIAVIDADGGNLGSTARATSRTARATTRSTTSIRATPASRSGRPATHGSASVSAGTSGSPNRRAAWPCSARNSCSTRPPSVANRTTPASARAITGSACSKAMPEPT